MEAGGSPRDDIKADVPEATGCRGCGCELLLCSDRISSSESRALPPTVEASSRRDDLLGSGA